MRTLFRQSPQDTERYRPVRPGRIGQGRASQARSARHPKKRQWLTEGLRDYMLYIRQLQHGVSGYFDLRVC